MNPAFGSFAPPMGAPMGPYGAAPSLGGFPGAMAPSFGGMPAGQMPTFPDMESFNNFFAQFNQIQGGAAPGAPPPAAMASPNAKANAPAPPSPQPPHPSQPIPQQPMPPQPYPTQAPPPNGPFSPSKLPFPTQTVVAGPTTYVDVASDHELLAGGVVKLSSDEQMRDAFASTLQLLKNDIIPWLQPDENGYVHVGIPFCGGFTEADVLHEFLKGVLPALPNVKAILVHVHDEVHTADTGISHLDPDDKIHYHASNVNLRFERMPYATVAFGFHPQITQPGWDSIIRNVVTHSKIAYFAMFAECEKEELEKICQAAKYHCVVKQNPFARAQFVPKGMPIDDLKRYNWLGLVRKE